MMKNLLAILLLLPFLPLLHAFVPSHGGTHHATAMTIQNGRQSQSSTQSFKFKLHMIDQKRRNELGISDDEDEYDLDVALKNNTDPFITKVIAGSFILVMIALLVVGLV